MHDETAVPPLILVIAYRADDHLEDCLHELASTEDVRVVDNDASSTTRDLVDKLGAQYIAAPTNVGFAAGVNLGLDAWWDGERDVLLLNPDARISPSAVAALQAHLHAPGPRRAAVGPRLIGDGNEVQRADWPLPSPVQMWFEALGCVRWWRGRRFVVGAVLMLSGEALAEVGGFDERYFLYAEAADWQCAVQRAGWTVAVVDSVTARHTGSASSSNHEIRERLFHASAEIFGRKWYGTKGWMVMRAAAVAAATRRCLIGSRSDRAVARRTLRRYLVGPVEHARRNEMP